MLVEQQRVAGKALRQLEEAQEQRRQVEEQWRQFEETHRELERQLEVESTARKYLIPPTVVNTAKSVLFYLVEKSSSPKKVSAKASAPLPPVCTGFFFSCSMALTVSRNVRERCESSGGELAGVALDDTALTFNILHEDAELDFMLLELVTPVAERPFFDVTPSTAPPVTGTNAVLFTCGIAWAAGMVPEFAGLPSITLVPATVTRVGRHGPTLPTARRRTAATRAGSCTSLTARGTSSACTWRASTRSASSSTTRCGCGT